MDKRPIGVFDSGLGGLTAVRQLRRVLPGEDIVYFGDTGRVPYGSRGADIIVRYAEQDIRFLLSQNVKFIMAACGTVSSTYPTEKAARLPVPYSGVVGATARAAAAATRNGRVGVIGTAATVRSGSYAAVLRELLPGVQITTRACPLFVPLVENGYVDDGNPVTTLVIAQYLKPLRDAGVDTLILGCTHYPLLEGMIGAYMGSGVTLIDSGKVTAQATAAALADLGLLNGRSEGGTARFFVSDTPDQFAGLERLFLGEYAGGPVERIAIENY
ncbi:MAG: glutamate racemase [Gemmiger sp.]